MKYSIYAFVDMKGNPYYIGKTNNLKRRKSEHLEEAKKGNKLPKYNKLRKILKDGGKFKVVVLAKALKESDAYLIERSFIEEYRKNGYNLMNLTKGGPEEKPLKKIKKYKRKTIKFKKRRK